MQRVVGGTVLLVVLLLLATPAGAVTAGDNTLPFDSLGQRVQDSARNVWVPVIAVIGIVSLGVAFIFALRSAAGMAIRLAIGLGILGIAVTGAGLAVLFPGLVTTVTLL